jgi:hypothetical protein
MLTRAVEWLLPVFAAARSEGDGKVRETFISAARLRFNFSHWVHQLADDCLCLNRDAYPVAFSSRGRFRCGNARHPTY